MQKTCANGHLFEKTSDCPVCPKRERGSAFRAVLSRDFELAYQPIVTLESGAVAAAEALARWRHAGQLVPTAQFMAFAESTGQIVAIGRLILEVVERDLDQVLAILPGEGFLAVNLSARELADDLHLDRS